MIKGRFTFVPKFPYAQASLWAQYHAWQLPMAQTSKAMDGLAMKAMKSNTNIYFLIVDLEATCSDDGSIPSHEMEIIEIGAVILNRATWAIDSEYQQFVRPVRHPLLKPFCIELTSITQEDIEAAPKFPEAISHFKEWINSYPNHVFCSWGNYDKKQFLQDCEFHNVSYPFGSTHRNLKQEFSEYLGVSKRFGMAQALAHLGIELKGTHHRGIDDAHNIAAIFRHINTTKNKLKDAKINRKEDSSGKIFP